MREQFEYHKMLEDLLGLDAGLSEWEINFIESLHEWEGDFTEKQASVLERIWDRHF